MSFSIISFICLSLRQHPRPPLLLQTESTEAAWYSDSWRFRKKITINSSKVPATQTDFPVLVSITDPNLKQYARSDGYDIIFTSSAGSGTKLSHEIESYTASTGKLIAWVKVPTVSSTANTVIYMYYGNPASSNMQDKANVWSNSFAGVWHMKEDPSGSAPQIKNSTSNTGIDGTSAGTMTSSDQVAGKINGALDYDGIDDEINISDNSVLTPSNDMIFSSMAGTLLPRLLHVFLKAGRAKA